MLNIRRVAEALEIVPRCPPPAVHYCNLLRELLDQMANDLRLLDRDNRLRLVLTARLEMADDKLDLLQGELTDART